MGPRELLFDRLAEALPKGIRFTIHHLTSLPQPCPALFSPPGHEQEELTCCEPHFLSVSVDHDGKPVHAFAIEVLVFTTATLTTVFVSKADSTGCLGSRMLSTGLPSPLRSTLSIFLQYLVEIRRKKGLRLVLSLFARAQAQYLFPGSVENSNKHVLDDRGLIKWWCRVLDSVLQQYPFAISSAHGAASSDGVVARGFLRVPGCDSHETRSFFRRADPDGQRWEASDPLRALGKPPGLPERCLIPRFPDDPKARFVVDLDDELPGPDRAISESPTKQPEGKWRSVKSLDQFWELMSFRQECAAGRLVGFIWGVFTPAPLVDRPFDVLCEEDDTSQPKESSNGQRLPMHQQSKETGDIAGSEPQVLPPGTPPPELPEPVPPVPTSVANADSPDLVNGILLAKASPSAVCLTATMYSTALHHLDTLDYSSVEKAVESTASFLSVLGEAAPAGQVVEGRNEVASGPAATERPGQTTPLPIAVLGAGLIRKKKRKAEDLNEKEASNLASGKAFDAPSTNSGNDSLHLEKKANLGTVV